jgi:CxxC motif-containing protein (DUF1111 family)
MKNRPFLSGSLGRSLSLFAITIVLISGFALLKHSTAVKASTTIPPSIPGLSPLEMTLYNSGFVTFDKTWSTAGGVGPVFTQANCATCHASPEIGGGAGTDKLRMDELFGTITDGSFNGLESEGGILLQPRSVSEFVPQCTLPGEVIPKRSNGFPTAATIFDKRLAPPAMGMGLIDSIPDSAILSEAESQQASMPFGIAGQANLEADENGVTRPGRFGYKAEAVDLIQFVSLAMLNEIGITNPILQTEVPPQGGTIPANCESKNSTEPNDLNGSQMISMYQYLLYLAPNPFPQNPNLTGENLFNSIGCSTCHLPSYTTGPKVEFQETWPEGSEPRFSMALSNQTVMLYSDLLLHNMGGLQDGFPFGSATGSQFRTTPLWGLSKRTIYLHDGRTQNLATAITDHDLGTGSEAHQVIETWKGLSSGDQTAVLQFIGSL